MTKIFITRKIPEAGITLLKQKGYQVDVYPKDQIMSQRELIRTLKKGAYDGVISLLTDKIDATVFEAAPSVKIFANYASGFDNIDLVQAKNRGVAVSNAPAPQTSESVAEHTLALALALAARIVEADEYMRQGKYKGWDPMLYIGMDVLGKTLGIVGVGRIGGRVAHYANGLGMKIVYTDVARNEELEKDTGATYCVSVDELLPLSDIVSLHVPLLDSTRHLINAERLARMKSTAFLVNTSRGPVIDEIALTKALKEKKIAGAALDVFEFEPKLSSGLAKLPNVILTPHIASASLETRDQMAEIAANNIIDFFEGRMPRNSVIK
ncbi:MAG: D-glycerate dehydrogenase [Patescibacteria group bacterium]|nr:D-glycerate dehydrogenase [Patescibacteria group bacterium]